MKGKQGTGSEWFEAENPGNSPGSQRLVLVGDQCQLPPTVQSTEV